MAKYNLENYLDKDGLGFPLNFRRGNPNPLDNSSVWKSLTEAQNYAQTDPTAYVGQILSVVNYTAAVADDEGAVVTPSQSTVDVYYIKDEAGTLEPVGTSPVGDEGTITVAEDGTVSLYGVAGLALTREDENGEAVNITYQPLYVNGKLTWVEPSATTVEGLAAEIEGLKTRISAIETAVGDAEGGLVKDVADHGDAIDAINAKIGNVAEGKTVAGMIADAEGEIDDLQELTGNIKSTVEQLSSNVYVKTEVYNKSETYSKSEVDTAVSTAEENAVDRVLGYLAGEEINADFDTLKEVAAWIESDTTASAELVTRISNIEKDYLKGADKTALQKDIDDLEAFVGALPEGAVSTTVVAYIQEAIDALKIDDYAKAADLTTLAGRVSTVEGLIGGTEVSIQIENAIKDKVDKVEGSRLMTDAEGTKLAGIAEGANVNVIDTVDTAQFGLENKHLTLLDIAMGKVTGLSDALEGKVDKVAGSRLLTSDEATKLEKLVLGENGEVSVSGKVAAGNVEGLEDWITARAATLKGLSENNLTNTLLEKLNGIDAGAQVNVIDTVSSEFTIDGKNLSVKAIAQDKITGLADALAGKVDAEDGYRLISETELERIAKIESGAQVNKIEGVKVGDTLLEIADKVVAIPVGSSDALGVVKSSDAENKVAIGTDGVMEVNSINVNKLVQADGDYLILNGGAATI